MFTVWGAMERFCDGTSRRGFLQVGAFGAALTLADLLRLRAGPALKSSQSDKSATCKSAILIYLPGGPSHMDMYDLKPDAPKEFRGEFNPIKTNVTGVQICQHFPMQATMWDKLACVRSIVSVNEHSDTNVMTGYSDRDNRIGNHPSFGSVISRLRGGDSKTPPFVSLRGATRGTEPGFVGVAHRPFTPSGAGAKSLSLSRGMTADRMEDRKALVSTFDGMRRELDQGGTLEGMDSFKARAFDMVLSGSMRDALDLNKATSDERKRYKGVEQFLTARRLVEAGAGCVTLAIGGWDTHGNNFKSLEKQLPKVDQGVANLVKDLHDRGKGKEVAVVMWGEFGRTPRINKGAGRDHWPQVMSALVAGGGLKMGQAVGSSTARGEQPKDGRCTPSQILATLYRAMGIDPSKTLNDGSGRPRHLLDDRAVVSALL
jgi:hypothetical protein